MAPRPPSPPPPSSEMNQVARAIEMMANAIQQNMAMALNLQATMHQLDALRAAATTSTVNHPQEQMGLAEFLRYNPPKFSGKATLDQANHWITELEKIFRATSCPEERSWCLQHICCLGKQSFG